MSKQVSTKRAIALIVFAKLWFMVAAFLLERTLPKFLGSNPLEQAAEFGSWKLVVGWVSVFNNVIIAVTIQTVAYFCRAGEGVAKKTRDSALYLQVYVGGGVAVLLFFSAPLIAAFFHDPQLTNLFRMSAIITLVYSFYAVFVGILNGLGRFQKQSFLDTTFSTLRMVLVLVMAWLFHKTFYALSGFVLSTIVITLLSFVMAKVNPTVQEEQQSTQETGLVKQMFFYMATLAVYLLGINVLLFVDGFIIKHEANFALQTLFEKASIEVHAKSLVGLYGGIQNIARLPYQLILAVTFVIFPLFSKNALQKQQDTIRKHIVLTLRYSIVFVLLAVLLLSLQPVRILQILQPNLFMSLMPSQLELIASSLRWLLFSYLCFSIFCIIGTILNSLGHTKTTGFMGVVAVAITTMTIYLILKMSPLHTDGYSLLQATARGMFLGLLLSSLMSLLILNIKQPFEFPWISLFKIILAAALTFIASTKVPGGHGGIMVLSLYYLVCTAVYFLILIVSNELSFKEFLESRKEQ